MDDRLTALEDRIGSLAATVEQLQQRVLALEGAPMAASDAAAAGTSPLPEPLSARERTATRPDLVAVVGMLGWLFVAVAGGYLLRAATESSTVPPAAGVAAGLAYALAWMVVAARAANRPLAGLFHTLAAALIGFPLVWEAATKFRVLSPPAAAATLALLSAAALLVAWRTRRQGMAWVGTLGACVASLALIAGTRDVAPFAVVLIALGTATLWMGYSLDWVGLRWPVAAVANLVVSAMTLRALSPQPADAIAVTLGVQLLLVVSYLGSIGIRTLVKGRNVVPFEVVQTAAILVVGFGGAITVARSTGTSGGVLGSLCLAIGVASYATALWFIARRPALVRNVYFYTSVAFVFVLAGCELLWPAPVTAVVWAALGVSACAAWTRTPRLFLSMHGAAYLCAAAVVTGVPGYGMSTIFGAPAAPWVPPSWTHVVVLSAGCLAAWLVARQAGGASRALQVPRVLIVLTTVWAGGAVAVGLLAPTLAGGAEGTMDAGSLATLRTSILSLAALGVAFIGRRRGCVEWSWLVYPLLVVVGLKMLAQDFSVSRPATLFVALALYGIALIIAPRLRRSGVAASTT